MTQLLSHSQALPSAVHADIHAGTEGNLLQPDPEHRCALPNPGAPLSSISLSCCQCSYVRQRAALLLLLRGGGGAFCDCSITLGENSCRERMGLWQRRQRGTHSPAPGAVLIHPTGGEQQGKQAGGGNCLGQTLPHPRSGNGSPFCTQMDADG